MSTIDRDQDVIQMAANLGLDWRTAPTEAIVEYCNSRVAGLLDRHPEVRTLDGLEALVCRALGLVIEEFASDEELDAVIAKYVAIGEYVFASQRGGFTDDTFATLIRRENADADSTDRFVALIDCRGDKAVRRYFTRWHEIAHVLTLVDGQMTLPFHRSTSNRDPVEQLMDKIAGEVGFFDRLFAPLVSDKVAEWDGLSFAAVDDIRCSSCPRASFVATLIAVVNCATIPAITFEARLGLKSGERRRARAPGLFPEPAPEAKLRVQTVGANDAARRAGLRIHQNMRVPETSAVYRLFHDPCVGALTGSIVSRESLSTWTTSSGGAVGEHDVVIEARRHGNGVITLVTLAS